MKNHTLYNIIGLFATLLFCGACTESVLSEGEADMPSGDVITVGADAEGLLTTATVATRVAGETKDAETVSWLVQPLKQGLDITYGNLNNGVKQNERVAILKLLPAEDGTIQDATYKVNTTSNYAEYTFNYRAADGSETTDKARWYDNGLHFFEGVNVPGRIRYSENISEIATGKYESDGTTIKYKAVTNLISDQSKDTDTGTDNDLGNYTLLAHYLGMPANTRISATVARIKLPFRHRLARVIAYILIDPKLKTSAAAAKIKGYANVETDETKPFRDDPATSSIRFCNVDVLQGVHDVYNESTKTHTLTPVWKEKERKVIPHFVEEVATFKTYESEDGTMYQGTSGFPATCPEGYEEVNYTNIPVYDLIVRPTYTSASNVMYDEALGSLSTTQYANKTNQIDFDISLDNGLTYEKNFVFDLDANYQTVVYLKITREGVDYNESGSELWVETKSNDEWYGVDNLNGQTLSESGSSWQRAFYNTHLGDTGEKITDGGFYDEDRTGEDGTKGQYVSTETWKQYLLQAYKGEGGEHHGDYFVLADNITIDAGTLPSDGLVFTGHLDGFSTHPTMGSYHTITLENAGTVVTCDDTRTDVLSKLYTDDQCNQSVPQLYWYKEVAQAPQRKSGSINRGEPIEIPLSSTYPAYLNQLDNDGKIVLYKEGEEYKVYTNRTFYKKTTGYLFAGLDGIYSTKQEDEQAAGQAIYNQGWKWEANVHREYNDNWKSYYWLPYRDVGENATNTGWRAEVMNLTVIGGSLFKDDAVVTGYVQNCWNEAADGTKTKVADHIPASPKYK